MTKKTFDAVRRADRALLGAFVLMFVTAGTAMAINPHTDQFPALRPAIVHEDAAASRAASAPITPPPAVVVIHPSTEELATLHLMAEANCLAQAMYYEARGEGVHGEMAVADVVINRTHATGFPRSVCGVVFQGSELDTGCQFSFTCNGQLAHARSHGDWARARLLAIRILSGKVHVGGMTGGATAFHAVDVSPAWGGQMSPTIQIGNHIFYRRTPRTTTQAS